MNKTGPFYIEPFLTALSAAAWLSAAKMQPLQVLLVLEMTAARTSPIFLTCRSTRLNTSDPSITVNGAFVAQPAIFAVVVASRTVPSQTINQRISQLLNRVLRQMSQQVPRQLLPQAPNPAPSRVFRRVLHQMPCHRPGAQAAALGRSSPVTGKVGTWAGPVVT
jgi:hypothetical protein